MMADTSLTKADASILSQFTLIYFLPSNTITTNLLVWLKQLQCAMRQKVKKENKDKYEIFLFNCYERSLRFKWHRHSTSISTHLDGAFIHNIKKNRYTDYLYTQF
jgi:pantothenate kinase-related protein Tda10